MHHHKFISLPHIFEILKSYCRLCLASLCCWLWLVSKVGGGLLIGQPFKQTKNTRLWLAEIESSPLIGPDRTVECLIFIVFFFKIIHKCLILVLKNASYWPHIWGIFTYGVALTTLENICSLNRDTAKEMFIPTNSKLSKVTWVSVTYS